MTVQAAATTGVDRVSRRAAILGALVFVLIAIAGLTWAKWLPYAHKVDALSASRHYSGAFLLEDAGSAGSAPSVSGAWRFTTAYLDAVWPALVVGLLLAAGAETLLPRRRVMAALSGEGRRSSLAGGVMAAPSMLCTCCTAPVASSLRRSGASMSATLAFWLGNPLLNPAVIVFLALVLPWQFAATRVVVGALLVFVASAAVARAAGRGGTPVPALPEADASPSIGRYGRSLARLAVTLLPEYLLAVFAVGLLRGWLFPLHVSGQLALVGLAVACVAGTLVVIPTAGEIPILVALLAAGGSAGVLGALLVTLPAVSAPSMAMVWKALGARVVLATAACVAAGGLVAAGLLTLLGV